MGGLAGLTPECVEWRVGHPRVTRCLTARLSSHTGQPSVHPVVLFKMAQLGYLYGLPC
jgi:hypothetical protein